ncbi:MAG: sulfatase family protein [Opitutaceae bacterium]
MKSFWKALKWWTRTSLCAWLGRPARVFRRPERLGLVGVVFAAVISIAAAAPSESSERPNFVFILSDDAAWQAVSAYRHGLPVETPNLDRIAQEGMRFDRCTVANSICSPSRATLLTGTHSHINGVPDNFTRFDNSQVTYPQLLQAAGYQTALIGKWHLHTMPSGYDYYDILDGQGRYFDARFIRKGEDTMYQVQGHTDEIIGGKGVEWLHEQRDAGRQFLLSLQFKVPHGPFMAPAAQLDALEGVVFPEPPTLFDDYKGRSQAARDARMRLADHLSERDLKVATIAEPSGADREAWNAFHEQVRAEYATVPKSGRERTRWVYQRFMQDYMRCMLALDHQVGRVLDTLEELGLTDNTVVCFAGDQGFFLGEHGWWDKRFMYEPSFRTPFLVRAPGVTSPGSATSALVQNIDWAPTILGLAGLPVPERMQGRSLVPLLRGEKPADWRASLYYHYYEGPEGDHKVARHEGVATERHKLIHFYELEEWEFYDLQTDPTEVRNRYDDPAVASVVAGLKKELRRLRAFYEVPPNDTIPRTERRPMQTLGVR